jgi:dipeptidyl aminopeptidase/acylaminoacyl peptidase
VDVASGKTTNLTPYEVNVLYLASSLSPNGKALLITCNQKGGYQNVASLDIPTKKLKWATDTKWEASAGDFSPSGKSFTYLINGDGLSDAYLVDATTLRSEKLPLNTGLNAFPTYPGSYSPSGQSLLLSHESSTQPADYFVYDIASGRSIQLTHTAIASLTTTAMPQSQIVHYKSFDGKTISALVWPPFNLKRDGSNPALVLPHRGPIGQVVDSWALRIGDPRPQNRSRRYWSNLRPLVLARSVLRLHSPRNRMIAGATAALIPPVDKSHRVVV